MPALVLVQDTLVPGFAVEVVRLFIGADAVELEIDGAGVSAMSIGDRRFQTDTGGNVWLRDTPVAQIKRLSAAEVLYDRLESDDVRGRVVLFGTTGTGLAATFVSAKGNALTALEAQALFVENLLSEIFLQRSLLTTFLEVFATLIGCIGVVILRNRLRSYGGQAVVLAYAALLVGLSLYAFEMHHMLVDPSVSIVAILIL